MIFHILLCLLMFFIYLVSPRNFTNQEKNSIIIINENEIKDMVGKVKNEMRISYKRM